MGIARPKSVDSKGAERGGGAGPVSSQNYRDWTEIDIHDSSLWQRRDGTGTSVASSGTISTDGTTFVYNMEASGKKHIQPGIANGTFYIAKAHLKPYEECGLAEPSGVSANEYYPEQFSIKVEVLFDDIPITGPVSDPSLPNISGVLRWGQNSQVLAGFVHYASDQNNAPALPDATNGFCMARMYKNKSGDPSASTANDMFKSGYLTGNAQASTFGATWKCQYSPRRDADHDALIFEGNFGAVSRTNLDRVWVNGGSYSTTNPRARSLVPGTGLSGGGSNAFTGASNRYIHIALGFCAFDSTNDRVFQVRVRRVRYLIQPIASREAFTAE
jgi:hypothetical protein